MTVESASYISGLNILWPLDSDSKSEGDNHLRLIKSSLKTSFPNINGAVTVTDEELNYLSGVASNVQTQINDLSATISAMTTRLANISSTFTNRAGTLSAAFTTIAGDLSATFNARAGTLSAAFTTRANDLSATITTLSQSISALNTVVASRPVYGAAVYRSGDQTVLTGISATIVFNGKYYDIGNTFSSATGRITAPTGTRFARFRCNVQVAMGTSTGNTSVTLVRDGSAVAAFNYSAIPVAGASNYSMPALFDIKTPFITAASGENFCLVLKNNTSATAVVTVTSSQWGTLSTFEAEFITWS